MEAVMNVLGISKKEYDAMIDTYTEYFWKNRDKLDLSADGIVKHLMNV